MTIFVKIIIELNALLKCDIFEISHELQSANSYPDEYFMKYAIIFDHCILQSVIHVKYFNSLSLVQKIIYLDMMKAVLVLLCMYYTQNVCVCGRYKMLMSGIFQLEF